MHDVQILILAIFAIAIAFLSWILWKVTIELGDFATKKRGCQNTIPLIQIRPGSPIRDSKLRSSEFDFDHTALRQPNISPKPNTAAPGAHSSNKGPGRQLLRTDQS